MIDGKLDRLYLGNRKRSPLPEKSRWVILELEKSLKENEPLVRAQYKSAGRVPDEAVVFTVAMYYETLKTLATE